MKEALAEQGLGVEDQYGVVIGSEQNRYDEYLRLKGQNISSRQLVWIEGEGFAGWGCSECDWIFDLPDAPTGKSLDEVKRNLETRLSNEFASHTCTKQAKRASGV
jgi:hypothetical protein